MIKIKTIGIWGFEGALRGCRMPYESFDKSDSRWCNECEKCGRIDEKTNVCYRPLPHDLCPKEFVIGEADMALCKRLIKAGSEHRKFLRMIHVQFDIKMPRYIATELDTYKVGTTKNSSSTMHLITKRELTVDDFSFDKTIGKDTIDFTIESINCRIEAYNKKGSDGFYIYSHDEREQFFKEIKQLLPESFMQWATYDMSYETLLNIYMQRKNHRLKEWSAVEDSICAWIKTLPHMEEFIKAIEEK